MSNKETPEEWLARHFECEFCDECGGDAEDHHVIVFLSNYFAQCLRTEDENRAERRGRFKEQEKV